MKNQRTRNRGLVLVWVALTLVVLIGFVALTTDYGLLVVNRRHLQNGTDAAAISAAEPLESVPGDSAAARRSVSAAHEYASDNGVSGVSVSVDNAANAGIGERTTPYTIDVSAQRTVDTPFARVLSAKYASSNVRSHSQVVVYPVQQMSHLKPWAIPAGFFSGRAGYDQVQYNQRISLKVMGSDQTDGSHPFFSAVAFNGLEPAPYTNYQNYIESGYGQPVTVPAGIATRGITGQYGQMPGDTDITQATDTAMQDNSGTSLMETIQGYGADDGTQWQNPSYNDPRLIFVPIIDQYVKNKASVKGFAAFYIEDYDVGGRLTGRFIKFTIPAQEKYPDPVTLDPQSFSYGVYTYRLSE